jgi:AcrR family transcriptional regulator
VKRRFARADWLDLGLEALAEAGPAGVTLEALCARAGKTRGSFYAHFASLPGFLAALAERWRETFTEALIVAAEQEVRTALRLDSLGRLAVHLDPRIEQGMRRLASLDNGVSRICRAVDERRSAYLAALYAASGRYSPDEAEALARIEYAAFVGFQQIWPDAAPDELLSAYRIFIRLTGRG